MSFQQKPAGKFKISFGSFLVIIAASLFVGYRHLIEIFGGRDNIFLGFIIGFVLVIIIFCASKYGSYIAVNGYRERANLIKLNSDNKILYKEKSVSDKIHGNRSHEYTNKSLSENDHRDIDKFLKEYESHNIPKNKNEMESYPIFYLRLFLLDKCEEYYDEKNSYIYRKYLYDDMFNYLNFEEEVAETLHHLKKHTGPIVTVRSPGEALPPPEMHIVRISNTLWKKSIARLMRVSRLVILAVDPSEHVSWEIKAIYKILPPERVMLYLPPVRQENQGQWNAFVNATQDYFPNALPAELGDGIFLWFDNQGQVHMAEAKGMSHGAIALQDPVAMALQKALGAMDMWEKPPLFNLPTPPSAPPSHRRYAKP